MSSETLRTLAGRTDEVNGKLALADGRLLSWSVNRTLRLWSVEGKSLRTPGEAYFWRDRRASPGQ